MTVDLNIGNVMFSVILALIGVIWHWVRGELYSLNRDIRAGQADARRLELEIANRYSTKDELKALEGIVNDLAASTNRLITRLEVLVASEEKEQQRSAPNRRRR